ncbi:MAG: hypothetical protein F6K14_26805 [Symploca sp. SIO2C1]|nr:hypothetical protein [Symploca sp. SIO2C1]
MPAGITVKEEIVEYFAECLNKFVVDGLLSEEFSVSTGDAGNIKLKGKIIDNKPWFHSTSLTKSLGLSNSSQAVKTFCSEDEFTILKSGLKGRSTIYVSLNGAAKIIAKTQTVEASDFRNQLFVKLINSCYPS